MDDPASIWRLKSEKELFIHVRDKGKEGTRDDF